MGTLVLNGATSGSTTLSPVDAVTATITLPSATATLATTGANTFSGLQTAAAGITMSGSASNISLGANYINYSGSSTDEGIHFAAGGTASIDTYVNGYVLNLYQNTSGANPLGIRLYSVSDPNGADAGGLDTVFAGNRRFAFDTNGGLRNYSANNVNISDEREKKNIELAPNYLDRICSIPVKTFLFKDQTDDLLNLGVIAQDVQAVAPELVSEGDWGTKDTPKMRLSIYQTDFQYALMKCIQEQQTIIQALAARIEKLEAK